MHYRMLVLTDKKNADTSAGAREYVYDTLEQDDSFLMEGGRFGSGVADWFVIGGRWSGALSGKAYDDRDGYKPAGYDDEAQIATQELYEKFLQAYEGTDIAEGKNGYGIEAVDLDYDPITPDTTIGKKWLVVVDYHA